MPSEQKRLGQYFTPPAVARSLVKWVVRSETDRLLDPSCGDGGFLRWHVHSVGVEVDEVNAALARNIAPGRLVHSGDFFRWSGATRERFDAIAGNPPFIRYQSFTGATRAHALSAATMLGADFNGLTSSWAPFVLVAAGLLRPGGRMSFVVPAELGHANYAQALLPALCSHFERVHVIAYRKKLFPQLSEDCWVLSCVGFGGKTKSIHLTVEEAFEESSVPPQATTEITLGEWESMGCRLRPFLLPRKALALYGHLLSLPQVQRFGALAKASIGYVSGANDFFHLRPSEARKWSIPAPCLRVAIRKAEQLPANRVTQADVARWIAHDERVLLLHLRDMQELPHGVASYLAANGADEVRTAYKCRNRKQWYVVPDVKTPAAFLTVMAGARNRLVRNEADCVCTNSLHTVFPREGVDMGKLQDGWQSQLAELGMEIEGHPLGGGMLKLEPGEAARVPVPLGALDLSASEHETLQSAIAQSKSWRHYA